MRYVLFFLCFVLLVICHAEEGGKKEDDEVIDRAIEDYSKQIIKKTIEYVKLDGTHARLSRQEINLSGIPYSEIRNSRKKSSGRQALKSIVGSKKDELLPKVCEKIEELAELRAIKKYVEDNRKILPIGPEKEAFLQKYYVERVISIKYEIESYKRLKKNGAKLRGWSMTEQYNIRLSIIKNKMPEEVFDKTTKNYKETIKEIEDKRKKIIEEIKKKKQEKQIKLLVDLQKRYDRLTKEFRAIHYSGNLKDPKHEDWKRFNELKTIRYKLKKSITEEQKKLRELYYIE